MTPDDDPSITDDTELYRRVRPLPDQIVPDENRGCVRVTSAAFIGQTEMSVVLEDTLRAEGREPPDALRDYPGDFLVALKAGFVREKGQGVVRTPRPEEPAHGDVLGKKTRGTARAFAEAACWIVAPPDACAEDAC